MNKHAAFLVLAGVVGVAAANGWLPDSKRDKPSIEGQIENAWRMPEPQDSEPFNVTVSAEQAAILHATLAGDNMAQDAASPEPAKAPPPSDPEAQYQLALAYADVNSPNFDMTQAEHWFTLAARQGHLRAIKQLGDMYRYGSPPDTGRAIYWYSLPNTLVLNQGVSLIGAEEDLDAVRKAHTELLAERNPRKPSEPREPMTAYEAGRVIGAILKYAADNAEAPQATERQTSSDDPKVAACRKEALKHITTCQKGTDYMNCDQIGCPEIVHCDGYARVCERHDPPYNTDDEYFCDKRNWRSRDVSLEKVLEEACPI